MLVMVLHKLTHTYNTHKSQINQGLEVMSRHADAAADPESPTSEHLVWFVRQTS